MASKKSPEQPSVQLDHLQTIDIGDAVYPKAPAEVYTMTVTITREQALVQIGELVRQVRNAEFDQEQLKPQMERSIKFHVFSVLPLVGCKEESSLVVPKLLSTVSGTYSEV